MLENRPFDSRLSLTKQQANAHEKDHEERLCAGVACVCSASTARSAHGEAVQRSRGVARNALLRDESRKALHEECSKTKSTMPDTMSMVSTDEDDGIESR